MQLKTLGALRNEPIDKNDRQSESLAVFIPWSLSGIAKPDAVKALNYLDDTAFLFSYKGRLVVTDESLYLTAHGDGSRENPVGFPRFEADEMDEVETWLQDVWEDLAPWVD